MYYNKEPYCQQVIRSLFLVFPKNKKSRKQVMKTLKDKILLGLTKTNIEIGIEILNLKSEL